MTLTKPEAGVMATRPATAPAAAPITLGCFLCHQLTVIQVSAAMAVAELVKKNALVASAAASKGLPALKANQPNQSQAAPSTGLVAACRTAFWLPQPYVP